MTGTGNLRAGSGTGTGAGRVAGTGTGTVAVRLVAALAAVLAAAVLLSGCSDEGGSRPSWTVEADPPGSRPPAPSPSADPSGSAQSAEPSNSPETAVATAGAWKTYTDPARKVSFDLPDDWIAQSVPPDTGTLPGALKVVVKGADGAVMATLKTGLPETAAPECPAPERKPYVVLSSTPVGLPSSDTAAIEPRVVFRLIKGYRYFGSYGITNMVGGADAMACSLANVVSGPAGTGSYSFGDLDTLEAFAPDEMVAPAKAFDTLDQAEKYVSQGSEFANVKRMLMSLVINT